MYFDAKVITLDIKEHMHVIGLGDASQTFLSSMVHRSQLGNGLTLLELLVSHLTQPSHEAAVIRPQRKG